MGQELCWCNIKTTNPDTWGRWGKSFNDGILEILTPILGRDGARALIMKYKDCLLRSLGGRGQSFDDEVLRILAPILGEDGANATKLEYLGY